MSVELGSQWKLLAVPGDNIFRVSSIDEVGNSIFLEVWDDREACWVVASNIARVHFDNWDACSPVALPTGTHPSIMCHVFDIYDGMISSIERMAEDTLKKKRTEVIEGGDSSEHFAIQQRISRVHRLGELSRKLVSAFVKEAAGLPFSEYLESTTLFNQVIALEASARAATILPRVRIQRLRKRE